MSVPLQNPTQVEHPWRATVRTVFAFVVGLCSVIPVIAATGGLGTGPAVAQAVAIAGAVTRVLAMPQVNDFLAQVAPWLAAE